MKLLSAVAVAGVTVVLLLTATATVTAACLANPLACAHGIGEEGAVSIPFDPHGGPMTVADFDAISRAIGAQVPTYSVLRDPDAYGTGWGGPSINMLAPTMKMAVARLEIAIGQRLNVVSGCRTAGYQAQLCQRVAGPCAPPGRSMHQLGLAHHTGREC